MAITETKGQAWRGTAQHSTEVNCCTTVQKITLKRHSTGE